MIGKKLRETGLADRLRLAGLFFLITGLPCSNSLMSLGTGLAFTGFVVGLVTQKWSISLKNTWPGIGLLLLFSLNAFYPGTHEKWNMLAGDLKVKLPLFLMPFVFVNFHSIKPFFRNLLCWGLLAYVITSLHGTFQYLFLQNDFLSFRTASPFISNVRMGILGMGYLLTYRFSPELRPKFSKWLILCLVWIVIYLIILQSYTAFVIGGILWLLLSLKQIKKSTRPGRMFLLIIGMAGLVAWLGIKEYRFATYAVDEPAENWPAFSPGGYPYKYDTLSVVKENGNYIHRYVCPAELYKYWPERSELPLSGTAENGQSLYLNLLRYMSSRGLRKDREGLMQLSDAEIRAIEKGTVNWLELEKPPLRFRLNQMFKAIDFYIHTRNPMEESLTVRLDIWRHGLYVWKQRFLTGFGIEGARKELEAAYARPESKLAEKFHWLHPHNQYLTISTQLGTVGLLLFLLIWLYIGHQCRGTDALIWFVLFSLAMQNEDLLETQAGVTQVAFFLFGLMQSGKDEKVVA